MGRILWSAGRIGAAIVGGVWIVAAVIYGSAVSLGIMIAAMGSSADIRLKIAYGLPAFFFLACLWLLPLLLALRKNLSRPIRIGLAAVWLLQFSAATIGLLGGKRYGPELAMSILNRLPQRK